MNWLVLFSTKFVENDDYNELGDDMKVKIFDEESEKDLEEEINNFLEELETDIIDIKYQVSSFLLGEEQVYCFSAMIVYLS